jgi:ComF family protein
VGQCRADRIPERGLNALLAVTLAPPCAACGALLDAPLDGPICGACWAIVRAELLPHLVIAPGPHVDAGRAAADYDGRLRDVIHAFKYEARRSLAVPLGAMVREAGRELCEGAACAVPVPLHPWRRLRRGFNQAADLAGTLGLPVVHALWRARPTAAQMTLPEAQRHRNVRRAFRLAPWLSRRRRERYLQDRCVVLVDDVMTTGATLDACAAVLKDAGAREVRTLTIARTPRRRARPHPDRDPHQS